MNELSQGQRIANCESERYAARDDAVQVLLPATGRALAFASALPTKCAFWHDKCASRVKRAYGS